MSDDPDPENLPPAGAGAAGSRRIVCEFCECSLANSGDVLKRSARAKELMKLEDTVETLTRELDEARTSAAALKTELDAAKLELSTKKNHSSIFG